MKVEESTINLGYMMVEKYMCVPKTKLIIPGNSSFSPYDLGKIMLGEHKGKFCLYPAHVGMTVSTKMQELLFIPHHEIICHVEPEDGEEFIPFFKFNTNNREAEWIDPSKA